MGLQISGWREISLLLFPEFNPLRKKKEKKPDIQIFGYPKFLVSVVFSVAATWKFQASYPNFLTSKNATQSPTLLVTGFGLSIIYVLPHMLFLFYFILFCVEKSVLLHAGSHTNGSEFCITCLWCYIHVRFGRRKLKVRPWVWALIVLPTGFVIW